MEATVPNDKAVPLFMNGVPGPGAYDADDHHPIPKFKICQPSPATDQYKKWQENTAIKQHVGPQTYDPIGHPDWQKGTKMGSAVRNEVQGTYELSPAPNRYKMLGDFDFRDPTDTKNSLGKVPKFAFGIKP